MEYPNGRVHYGVVERDKPLRPGEQFEMHGRRWQAVQSAAKPTRVQGDSNAPIVCRPSVALTDA